eukprot:TRINITY_DN3068_c0_g1_i1.p2 TRINITY_DN3068_c0_g1~~TRINITY_DN3068_c0_g1_i1.p2  ORF type:complete len:613 (+),score=147.52 TRINITY_DN3068_c0_g1_i1:223-1839(+)
MAWNATYEGELRGGKAEGRGTLRYDSGTVYEGEWRADLRCGRGACLYTDGRVYEGEWRDGWWHGTGTLKEANGDVWEGKWEANTKKSCSRKCGTFTLHSHAGDQYEVVFNNRGEEVSRELLERPRATTVGGAHPAAVRRLLKQRRAATLVRFDVDTTNNHDDNANTKQRGKKTLRDGGDYEGEMSVDKANGVGTCRWPDGSVYEGEWWNDRRHVQGTMRWPDGREYVGQWTDDSRHGQGRFRCCNGDVYDGGWRSGVQHGPAGVLQEANSGDGRAGNEWRGAWEFGVRHGRFELRTAARERYEVVFHRGTEISRTLLPNVEEPPENSPQPTKQDYVPVTHCEAGTPYEKVDQETLPTQEPVASDAAASGEYEGEWIDSKPHGKGTLRYADGVVYAGEWRDGWQCGSGTLREASGDVWEGTWVPPAGGNGSDGTCRHGKFELRCASGEAYEVVFEYGKEVSRTLLQAKPRVDTLFDCLAGAMCTDTAGRYPPWVQEQQQDPKTLLRENKDLRELVARLQQQNAELRAQLHNKTEVGVVK